MSSSFPKGGISANLNRTGNSLYKHEVNRDQNSKCIITEIRVPVVINRNAHRTRHHLNRNMRNPDFDICENKDACTSSHLLWLYSSVCVEPGRKPKNPIFSSAIHIFLIQHQLLNMDKRIRNPGAWDQSNFRERLLEMLTDCAVVLRSGVLKNYFNYRENILAGKDRVVLNRLADHFLAERANIMNM